ncbi:unnamed protein product [Candidula unifasciata]|uniref:Dermatopontin n=1 Tax=Candidula unifasciata TaxID=100452 RepID=A0A8S3YEA7_9EUPU|nr:unnamed protein product [Candidula unifasciata]
MIRTVVCLLLLFCIHGIKGQWVNDYHDDAVLDCRGNQLLSSIGSIHKNSYEDRLWKFQCRPAPGPVYDCDWTSYLNEFDQVLNFTCPRDYLINGMMSYFDNLYKDRRFLVKCCRVYPRSTTNCHFTAKFVNDWDKEMNFSMLVGECIKGVYSVHDNRKQDRRWKFNICNLV